VPTDVITTRIITQGEACKGDRVDSDEAEMCAPPGEEIVGFRQMGLRILDEGGPAALMRGWQARVGYWAPAIGIFLSCYCSIRQTAVAADFFP
jgi:hypothetical protein